MDAWRGTKDDLSRRLAEAEERHRELQEQLASITFMKARLAKLVANIGKMDDILFAILLCRPIS